MADHPLTWTTAAAALVVAAQLLAHPLVLLGLAAAVVVLTFAARGHRLLECALVVGVACWWIAMVTLLPGSPHETVLLTRPSWELGPGVAFGGPLTLEQLTSFAASACRATIAVLALCLPLRHVPGPQWHHVAARLLGGRASLVAPWCHLGDALRERPGEPMALARRLADDHAPSVRESVTARWLRFPLLVAVAVAPLFLRAVAPEAVPVPGIVLVAAVAVLACAWGSLPGREVGRARG